MTATVILTVIYEGREIATEKQAIDVPAEIVAQPLPPPSPFSATFKDAVAVMRQRKLRRDELRNIATTLAEAMSDHIEDAEGWHGEDRRERMADYPRAKP